MAQLLHNWDHAQISAYLLGCYFVQEIDLYLAAAADDTRRHNLRFVLDYDTLIDKPFGGTVNYNKKKRRFDFIEYCDGHGYAVRISVAAPGVHWSAWQHRDYLYHNVPELYHSDKKLAQWLLKH